MAMRRFNQNSVLVLEAKVVKLFCQATFGASGAVTLAKTPILSKGVKSLVKQAGTGLYTLTLEDSYNRLLDVNVRFRNASGIATAGGLGIVDGTSNVKQAGGGVISLQFSNAGTAANPASGDTVYLVIELADSSI